MAGKLDFIALFETTCAFIYLYKGILSGDFDYLGHKFGTSEIDIANLILSDVSVDFDRHQIGNDACYNTCTFHACLYVLLVYDS